MKILHKLMGLISVVAILGTFGMAIFAIGALLFKGSSDAPVNMIASEPSPITTEATEAAATKTPTALANVVTVSGPAISVDAGEKVFKKCKACHTVDEGGKKKTGPNLWGIVGSQIASVEGFKYSDAMLGFADQSWEPALLDEYLTKPKNLIKGTAMSFAGLKKQTDRQNLIAYLAQQSGNPLSAADLGLASAAEATTETTEDVAVVEEDAEEEENTFLASFSNPPARTPDQQSEIDARVAALTAEIAGMDYERARYHPLHFPPLINEASNEECLTCHQEIMSRKPLETSPAGVPSSDTLAWYQTLATYEGTQETFHYRHLQSDFAKQVMNLECVFCHKGNDPREESPDLIPSRAAYSANASPKFTLRKLVNPSTTCLLCHGAMPDPVGIMELEGPWHEIRADFEDEETLNGCLTCHGEYGFRTNRHNVSYLNAANIEDLATASSDTCYGCHGGRQWYRISYPYPRHPWPDMDEETPDWALDRPTESDPEYQLAPPASE